MNDAPKISFIPKGSLAREETFLERPRPRSLLGFFATFIFLASTGSYVGLYLYNDILAGRINGLALQIKNIQKDFEQPEVAQARVFRARAELAKKLFNEHIVVTPLFDFLATNTTESVFYHDLKFIRGEKGELSLDVSGEAPSYASLAYQADVFRQKGDELLSFSVDNIMLTKTGSIGFVFHMTFVPQYLSYVGSFAQEGDEEPTSDISTLSTPATRSSEGMSDIAGDGVKVLPEATTSTSLFESTSTLARSEAQCEAPLVAKTLEDGSVVCEQGDAVPAMKSSWLTSFWTKFKFW